MGKHDAALLKVLASAPGGLPLHEVCLHTKLKSGAAFAPLQRLIARGQIRRDGQRYVLPAVVAKASTPAAAPVKPPAGVTVWSGRKDDPLLSGGVRPA